MWGRRVGIDKSLSVFWTTVNCLRQQCWPADCSIQQVQRRRTLAWKVLCAFSERSDAACCKMLDGYISLNELYAARKCIQLYACIYTQFCTAGLQRAHLKNSKCTKTLGRHGPHRGSLQRSPSPLAGGEKLTASSFGTAFRRRLAPAIFISFWHHSPDFPEL